MNYTEARDIMSTARDIGAGKPLKNNTRLYERRDWGTMALYYAVTLHSTDVVTIHPGNEFTLNSGGYRTVTTKSRINEFSPARLFQRNYVWYIANPNSWDLDLAVKFFDGIRVDASGYVLN